MNRFFFFWRQNNLYFWISSPERASVNALTLKTFLSLIRLLNVSHYGFLGLSCTATKDYASISKPENLWNQDRCWLHAFLTRDRQHSFWLIKKAEEEEGRTRMQFLLTNCFNQVYLLSDRVTLTLPLLMLVEWGSDSDFCAPCVVAEAPSCHFQVKPTGI